MQDLTVAVAVIAFTFFLADLVKGVVGMGLPTVPAIGGMLLGQGIRNRLHPEVFRRWFFVGLLVLGTYMVIRALSSA